MENFVTKKRVGVKCQPLHSLEEGTDEIFLVGVKDSLLQKYEEEPDLTKRLVWVYAETDIKKKIEDANLRSHNLSKGLL